MKILDLQWKDNDVKNYERFLNEFGPTDEKKWTKKSKPEDFRVVFEGNQTEDFRMGIKVIWQGVYRTFQTLESLRTPYFWKWP